MAAEEEERLSAMSELSVLLGHYARGNNDNDTRNRIIQQLEKLGIIVPKAPDNS